MTPETSREETGDHDGRETAIRERSKEGQMSSAHSQVMDGQSTGRAERIEVDCG
jgi:hypothetical protein